MDVAQIGAALRNETKAAFRAIASQPGFSALVVAVLGVGLACTIFMLVMINAFVLRPLPFPAPDQLLQRGPRHAAFGRRRSTTSPDRTCSRCAARSMARPTSPDSRSRP